MAEQALPPLSPGEGDQPGSTTAKASTRQRRLWADLLRARYLALAALGVAGLFAPAGINRFWLAVGLIVVGLPYNAVYDYLLHRTGVLYPTLVVSDTVLVVALVALAPSLLPWALLLMLAITANAAVAFGRRVALQCAVVAFVGLCLVTAIDAPADAVSMLGAFGVLALFTAYTVGTIARSERELGAQYGELMSGIDAIVWEQLTAHPSTLYVNEEAVNVLGYPAEDWAQPGMWSRVVHPDDRFRVRRDYRSAITHGESREVEYRMIAADGRLVWVQDRIRVEADSSGRPSRVRGVMVDVTNTKDAEHKASQFVDLVNGIKLALFVFGLDDPRDDDSLVVRAINPEAARLFGIKVDDAVGRPFTEVITMPAQGELLEALADTIHSGQGFTRDELRSDPARRGGRVYSAYAFPLPDDTVGLSLHDITERTMAGEVLRRQALHDGLTGLPNRTLINERMRMALESSGETGEGVALLVMDIDEFKQVNDALGHDQGDRLLIELSRRLQRVLKDADTIARLGGDEFAVLYRNRADVDGVMAVAQSIHEALEQPFQLGGISLHTSVSIGIALFPEHADSAELLAQRADIATYAAKRTGSDTAMYAPELDSSSVHKLALLGELRGAITDNELVLFYQAAIDLDTGHIRSAEALVRWQHPEHGLMPPGEFIELAEVSGLIQPMTRWIIERAVTQIREWLDVGIAVKVGVNLAVRNLYEKDLVPWISDLLIEHGVDAHLLKLEVTESELMDDPLLALEVLGKLRALGASTSIDDFGTGYSSLAYLKHLPIDELKIDQSFVGNMVNDHSDLTIVRSTIELSHSLGLSVVAEGVEDAETLRMLASIGCDRAQGYFISRPVPAATFQQWISESDALREVQRELAGNVASTPSPRPIA